MVDLSKMTKKQKREYIWDYYKLHIIGSLIVIIVVGSFIHNMITAKEYEFNVSVIGGYLSADEINEIDEEITSLIYGENENKKIAYVDYYSLTKKQNNNMLEMDYNMVQKFMAKIATQQVDVILMHKEIFKQYEPKEFFFDLGEIDNLDLNGVKLVEKDGKIFGVYLEGNKIFNKSEYTNGEYIVCVPLSSTRQEQIVDFFDYIFTT
ncbi:hypothetical protein SH2C18_37840 [Clostridium sediminicola]|uniref:hypothetical protein n=1 Tax=Clostridium sediminicola TaxID=3114879 RepID=UPI0031F23423